MWPDSVIALTGNAGSGKSTALKHYQELGAEVISADSLVSELYKPGNRGHKAVLRSFGSKLINNFSEINRLELRRILLSEPEKRREFEKVIHPLVEDEAKKWVEVIRRRDKEVPIIYEIPLLFETCKYLDEFLAKVLIYCSKEAKLERLEQRNISKKDAEKLLFAQIDDQQKLARVDFALQNDSTLEALKHQVYLNWIELCKKTGNYPPI